MKISPLKTSVYNMIVIFCILLMSVACTPKKETQKLVIYTSYYKEVIELFKPGLKKSFPDVEIEWFQAGSENVAARVLAEQQGGGVKADILITSDIFFYQEQKRAGNFAPITATHLGTLPPHLVDADKMFAVTRFPVMVIAINTKKVLESDRPKSFKDLIDPKFKDKLTMPSPLESGTALATSMYLSNIYGEEYFKGLRKNNIVSAGGNGATMSRIQTGEKPVGLVLMENILQAKEKGSDVVDFIIPEEGAFAIPSPMAIFKSSKNHELANKIFDWFISPNSQEFILKGWIYSAYPDFKAPAGAPEWKNLKVYPWSLKTLEEWGLKRQETKDLFQNIVLK